MLEDRPVFVAIASGGRLSGEQARQRDFLTPYLTTILATVGLRDLSFFRSGNGIRDGCRPGNKGENGPCDQGSFCVVPLGRRFTRESRASFLRMRSRVIGSTTNCLRADTEHPKHGGQRVSNAREY
ncbi:hypothetical protein AS026_33930 [Rhizobium altiplani]|uniref:Uncharacterized protein n=1 Tax=Rhizobium altiplani TaxID=1864509 RepID=A0A109JWS7_9HYPH|nr:hypothetical protein AS026_33930 [Rhizobium altiplani]